jgi:signal peptidase II
MNEPKSSVINAGASRWLWLSIVVIGLDQITKFLIMDNFAEFEELELLPMLELMRLHNEGVAFSFFSGGPDWQRWAFIALGLAVSIGILVWLRRLPAHGQNLLAASLALVQGGALGNVIDRVLWGHVVDFIRVHYQEWYFPAFNVADSAITVGAGLLLLENLLEYQRSRSGVSPRSSGIAARRRSPQGGTPFLRGPSLTSICRPDRGRPCAHPSSRS